MEAQNYCNEFIQQNYTQLPQLFLYFLQCPDEPSRFWLLHSINDIMEKAYP